MALLAILLQSRQNRDACLVMYSGFSLAKSNNALHREQSKLIATPAMSEIGCFLCRWKIQLIGSRLNTFATLHQLCRACQLLSDSIVAHSKAACAICAQNRYNIKHQGETYATIYQCAYKIRNILFCYLCAQAKYFCQENVVKIKTREVCCNHCQKIIEYASNVESCLARELYLDPQFAVPEFYHDYHDKNKCHQCIMYFSTF